MAPWEMELFPEYLSLEGFMSGSGFARYRQHWFAALVLFIGYLAIWLLLTRGQGVPTGLLFSLIATWLALRLLQSAALRFNPLVLPSLLTFFLRELLNGAWAVARITLHRNISLQSQWADYHFASADPRVHLLLSALTGLLPGTLSSRIDGKSMRLHLLDGSADWRECIYQLERRLMRLLPASAQGGG
jgi:multicomponent Na+:H+ antiporter subunit E